MIKAFYFLCAFTAFPLTTLVKGVQITDMKVPPFVKNGTSGAVILDCVYILRPEESKDESGLVVKWFFENGPAPVYQWIPPQGKPQDLGILKGKLKLDYKVSTNNATMHRALYIINPTTDLSGEYKCSVSTFQDEDFMIKKMIVYAPEKRLEVTQSKAGLETVNITCKAQGVYPEPKMFLYKDPDKKDREPMQGVIVEKESRGGAYDISASALVSDEELSSPTFFFCKLEIPNTPYHREKNIIYYPGQALPWTDSSGSSYNYIRLPLVGYIILITAYCLSLL